MEQATLNHLTDEQLVERALAELAAGESAGAFDVLAARWRPRLVAALWKRTRSEADAEDVAQDALLRAHQKLELFSGQHRFSTWLFTIAFRLDISRRRREKPTVSLAVFETEPHEVASAGDPTSDLAADRELADNLWAIAARELNESYYTVLWLRYGEQQSPAEIARVLNKTKLAVRVTLHRARQKLAPHVAHIAEQAGVTAERESMNEANKTTGDATTRVEFSGS